MKLTLDAAAGTLAEIDLGDLVETEGELEATGGNLYLYIDGIEVGSLWFHRNGDNVSVTLGAFSEATQGWEYAGDVDGVQGVPTLTVNLDVEDD